MYPAPHHTGLRRMDNDKVLAGVCGAFGRSLGIDSNLVRIGWVVLLLLGGSGIFVYLICWGIIPDQDGKRTAIPWIMIGLLFLGPICIGCGWFSMIRFLF